jgi:hypothetical protein
MRLAPLYLGGWLRAEWRRDHADVASSRDGNCIDSSAHLDIQFTPILPGRGP